MTTPDVAPAISLRDVDRIYGPQGASTVALKDIDLEIARGEIVAVVGPSGSGKSTLLHLIGAMDSADRGQVLVGGQEVGRLNDEEASRFRREKIGFVFQFFNLIPTLSNLDNVALPARLAGTGVSDARQHAAELLERVGLADRATDSPDSLSGGQQQRVAVARALINNPEILLADEPTGALDRQTGHEILELLVSVVRDRKGTLVMATHSDDARDLAERVVRIEDGRLVKSR
jgi:putative ABC transport system ATP-binding protein